MAEPKVIQVDPGGDVILICGDTSQAAGAATSIRVSSAILNYASPVFRAMFSKRFKEGNQLAASSKIEVPLPDDDPENMQILCHVIHMQHAAASPPTSPQQILRLAEMCDKYDCTKAITASAGEWIADNLRHADNAKRGLLLPFRQHFNHYPGGSRYDPALNLTRYVQRTV
ncbi:hypothetical protein LTR08_002949 [Meristemomyces frigidus]|nr:hypothetical protein LTR08_002949 [Meristemomyces frigidus]